MIREYRLDAEKAKSEEKRMAGKRRAKTNYADAMIQRLAYFMDATDQDRIKAGLFTITRIKEEGGNHVRIH